MTPVNRSTTQYAALGIVKACEMRQIGIGLRVKDFLVRD